MKVDGRHTRTIWLEPDGWSVGAIDQARLPHRFETIRLTTVADAARAIATMQVRGAPLIGATAAYGIALALNADASDAGLNGARRLRQFGCTRVGGLGRHAERQGCERSGARLNRCAKEPAVRAFFHGALLTGSSVIG